MWKKYSFGIFLVLISTMVEARVIGAERRGKITSADPMPYYYFNNIDGHPGTYSYGFDVADPATGNTQFRTEERYPNGTVVGSYGYVDAWGRPQRFRYIADHRGYRVTQERTHKPYIPPLKPIQHLEDSITWTRPKRPTRPNINSIKNYENPLYSLKDREKYFLKPPSYYAED